jgi:hypothetical protein
MSNLIAAVVASVFTLSAASTFAQTPAPGGTREALTAEQKTEIRDRVERLKAERAKAEAAKATPATPKADAPKKTSKAVTKKSKRVAKGTPAKPVTKKATPKA